jgi:hypothetical protein
MEQIFGTFHDALTGETIVRELTTEELVEYEAIISDADTGTSAE